MVPAEILTINNDSSTDDSSSNGSLTKSSTDTSNSDSANEEEERANLATLAKTMQTSVFSKRIMIEVCSLFLYHIIMTQVKLETLVVKLYHGWGQLPWQ